MLLAVVGCGSPLEGGSTNSSGDSPGARETHLTVLAASSLTEAFTEIAGAYELHNPETEVALSFDGSQRLRSQLEHGAKADIFASADWKQVTILQEAGLLEGEPVNFAHNRLAFLFNSEFGAAVTGTAGAAAPNSPVDPSLLLAAAQSGVKVVLALPQVPAGQYAGETLELMAKNPDYGPAMADGIRANVVSRETNVRSVAQKVALGEADAGIAYVTDALPPFVAERVQVIELPASLAGEVKYSVAATSVKGKSSGFIDFLLSEPGQNILEEYGFSRIDTPRPTTP